ncbi:MAG: class II fumarate hydratase [Deltaproteobacteria bacterium]|nr:class II fumarate hydratase [Deltaproteobacteria bacterium]
MKRVGKQGGGTRMETDSMGPMAVPTAALYGASTARAVENFPISGAGIPAAVIRALGLIKWAAAEVNGALGLVPKGKTMAIAKAAQEVACGEWHEHFVVDVYQTGSGTSSNMNANEVIANRAALLLGKAIGSKAVHPNDDVNFGQSSNDVFPTAIHVAVAREIVDQLLPALAGLEKALKVKARAFDKIVKAGRTHLQDATPIRLGQEFSGYAHQIRLSQERLQATLPRLYELPLGGTAVGTGVNTHPQFAQKTIAKLRQATGIGFRETRNHFQAQAAPDVFVELAGQLVATAVAMTKIANDIRWLASGPRCGLGELILPAVQPGSSIMPGKINPVILESVIQLSARVIANGTAVTLGGQGGYFELNVMYPLMADALCESIALLTAGAKNFAEKCVTGLKADAARCAALLEQNLTVGTSLAPVIGYDAAAKIIKEAFANGSTLREVAEKRTDLSQAQLAVLLDPSQHTRPGIPKR